MIERTGRRFAVATAAEIRQNRECRAGATLFRGTEDRGSPMPWQPGGFTLRVAPDPARGGSGGGAAVVEVAAPFAVIGRAPGIAVRVDDPAVSARHVYLHLDRRGLFAVDLATRTGTRVGASRAASGWLRPGDSLELAGRRVELLELDLGDDEGESAEDIAEPPRSPLDDTGDAPLVRLSLHPEAPPREPLSLNSQLVFAGRGASCGVRIDSPSAMRVHCVLVRGRYSAYLVDLVGRGTWINDRQVADASPLVDGDLLMIGSGRFGCRVEPFGRPRAGLPAPLLGIGLPVASPVDGFTELLPASAMEAAPLHLIPTEAQAAVLGWMMGQIQGRQDEAIRRQSEFQVELVRLVAEIHRDNHAVLNRHLERADAIHRELSELRDEMKNRFGVDALPAPATALGTPPPPPPLRIAPAPPPESPEEAANWLIARVNQLDQENRKGWKDLLGRIAGRKEG